MPTLDLWPMPGPAPSSGAGTLGTLTREANNRVYYTARGDTLGELDVQHDRSREWLIPPALHGGGASGPSVAGIERGTRNTLWCALAGGGRLLHLDAQANVMRAYGSTSTTPLPHQFPFSMPMAVRPDQRGNIWYAGLAVLGQPQGPIIGRLHPGSGDTSYWVLNQMPSILVTDLWIQARPLRIWLSLLHWNHHGIVGNNIPLLACLDPASGQIEIWSRVHNPPFGMFHYLAGARSVRGDATGTPKAIWFVHHTGFSPATMLRLDIATRPFREFAPLPALSSYTLDLDGNGMPFANAAVNGLTWVRSLACGTAVSLSRHVQTLPVQKMRAPIRTAKVRPVAHEIKRGQRPVERHRVRCFDQYDPLGVDPAVVAVSGTAPPAVYFTAPQAHVIGRLLP